jgi:glyoxylase-like metal-dependent hydrolase (beta-lactamase superfamily II)
MSHQIHPIKVQFAIFKNYSYILTDLATKETALIDPTWEFAKINSIITGLGLDLRAILLTHSHFDHVTLVKAFVKHYQPKVYMSAKEIAYYKYQCPNLCPVEQDSQIKLGETTVTCLETPGHSAGSMCFLLTDALFTGDTVFIEGCGMCDTPGGNPWQMYQSIRLIRERVAPDVAIYPSHSYGKQPGLPLSHLLTNNAYFRFASEAEFVAHRMRPRQKKLLDFK